VAAANVAVAFGESEVLRIPNPNPNPQPCNSVGPKPQDVVKHRAQSYVCALCPFCSAFPLFHFSTHFHSPLPIQALRA